LVGAGVAVGWGLWGGGWGSFWGGWGGGGGGTGAAARGGGGGGYTYITPNLSPFGYAALRGSQVGLYKMCVHLFLWVQ